MHLTFESLFGMEIWNLIGSICAMLLPVICRAGTTYHCSLLGLLDFIYKPKMNTSTSRVNKNTDFDSAYGDFSGRLYPDDMIIWYH